MEIQYGISIKNKYDLFLENDDPLEVLQQQEELKNAAKKAVKTKKQATEKDVKSKKKDKPPVVQNKSPASVQESNDKDSAPADNQKKQKTEVQVKPLKDRGNRPPPKSDSQTDPSLKSGKDDSKPSEPSQRKFSSRVFGNRRGAQNGERRGFANNSDNKNLENQENLDRTGQEGRRFGGNKFSRPEGGEGNQKFGNGFAESRTFRGRGGRRGFNRPRGGFRGGRGFGKPEGDRDDIQKSDEQPPKSEGEIGHWENEGEGEKKNDQGPGYRGRRDFGWRGRGRGRGGFGRRDKHDGARGTPRPVEKKDGSGSHNWGTVMDDLEAQKEESSATTAAPPATTITNAKTSWADMTEAAEEEAAQNGENVEGLVTDGGSNLMTLDEYKAAEEGKRVKAGFNIRKPNEGCNTDGWNSFVLKKKSQEAQDHDETEEERQNKMQKGLKDHHKVSLEIPITFADSRRMGNNAGGGRGGPGRRTGGRNFEGRGRGGEGSFNKRGGRGGGGGGPKRTPKERAPDVADERLFPSLSSTTPQ